MSIGLMIWLLMFGAASGSEHGSSVMAIHAVQVQAEPKVGTYGFVHEETTGITSSVIVNGVERRIQFHPASDPIAVKSLNALSWKYFSQIATARSCFWWANTILRQNIQPNAMDARRLKSIANSS